MIRPRSHVCAVAAVALICLLSSACSGSSGTTSAPSSATASTATSSPATSTAATSASIPSAVPSAAAPATPSAQPNPTGGDPVLKKINLVASDLPATWTAKSTGPASTDSAGQAQLVRCAGGGKNTTPDKVATLGSELFSSKTATVSSSTARYRSSADVVADTALLKRPKLAACLKALAKAGITSSLPATAKLTSIDLTVRPGSAGGPKNVVATSTDKVVVSAGGHLVTLYQNTVFITGPRIEAQLAMENVGAPIPPALQKQLTRVLAARAARA